MKSNKVYFSWSVAVLYLFFAGALWGCTQNGRSSDGEPIDPPANQSPNVVQTQIRSVTESIKEEPDNAVLYATRGRLYLKEGIYKQALTDAKKAISLDTTRAEYYTLLARSHRAVGEVKEGLQAAVKAIDIDYNDPDLLVMAGEMYIIMRDYKPAMLMLEGATNLSQHTPKAHFYKSIAEAETGDTAAAIKSLQTSIKQDPAYADSYNMLARIYHVQRKYSELLMVLQEGLASSPTDAMIYHNVGTAYNSLGQSDTAIYFFKKSIDLKPDFYANYYNIGSILFTKKQFEEAESWFRKSLQEEPRMPEANYYLARSLDYQQKKEEAIEYYRKTEELNSIFAEEATRRIKYLTYKPPVDKAFDVSPDNRPKHEVPEL